MIHPIAPFYSLLIRVDPTHPYKEGNFVCDLCTEMPKPTDGGKTYTFKIHKGVQFSDGTELTAHDIVATYQKIIFPPQGVASARKAFYVMVDSVTAPDPYTVVFKLVITSYSIHYTKLYEIVAFSRLVVLPEVQEAEINPLIVKPEGEGVVGVDALRNNFV